MIRLEHHHRRIRSRRRRRLLHQQRRRRPLLQRRLLSLRLPLPLLLLLVLWMHSAHSTTSMRSDLLRRLLLLWQLRPRLFPRRLLQLPRLPRLRLLLL